MPNSARTINWNSEEERILVDGLKSGLRFSQICVPGRSRNSCISHYHTMVRNGEIEPLLLPNRGNRTIRKKKERGDTGVREDTVVEAKKAYRIQNPSFQKITQKITEAVDLVPEISANAKSLLELQHDDCRYPVADKLFCGAPQSFRSYCAGHARVCYLPMPGRSRDVYIPQRYTKS